MLKLKSAICAQYERIADKLDYNMHEQSVYINMLSPSARHNLKNKTNKNRKQPTGTLKSANPHNLSSYL